MKGRKSGSKPEAGEGRLWMGRLAPAHQLGGLEMVLSSRNQMFLYNFDYTMDGILWYLYMVATRVAYYSGGEAGN